MNANSTRFIESSDISVVAERINPDGKPVVAQDSAFHSRIWFTDVKANWALAFGQIRGRTAWHGRQSALHYVFHFVVEGAQIHNGSLLKPGRLMIYAPSAEFTAQDQERCAWTAVGLAPALAAPILGALRLDPRRPAQSAVLVRATPRAWAALLRASEAARAATAEAPLGGPPPELGGPPPDRCLPALLAALAGVAGRGRVLAPTRTFSTISRAEVYLNGNEGRRVRMPELSAAVGVGQRALRQAYLKVYGMSPIELFKARQLALARGRLRAADRRGSVSAVAARIGIYSFGRFSVEYRRLYGESPSRTLARGRGSGAWRG